MEYELNDVLELTKTEEYFSYSLQLKDRFYISKILIMNQFELKNINGSEEVYIWDNKYLYKYFTKIEGLKYDHLEEDLVARSKEIENFHSEVENILNQRQETHGEFKDVGKTSQLLKNILRGSGYYHFRSDVQKEALEMICVKLARSVLSVRINRDSVVDIIGYATLMLKDIDNNNLKGE